MKKIFPAAVCCLALALVTSCASKPGVERGPNGTIAYFVPIEASDPGARIEANGDYIGTTPVSLRIWGDKDGTFHNFGSAEYVIRALPISTNGFAQKKTFRTGGFFAPEDRIPTRLYFDMQSRE